MAEFVNWKAEMSQNKEALYLQNLRFDFFVFYFYFNDLQVERDMLYF